ncbi:receptor-type tyrosine-protein phosphatase S-like isoform X1 [Symsagittifera roscoffensis]|uniref:receptor-type tyrosine-protein phosphatase S-like isoform X1 n=1 Tax=Symsagittifera roscoffensis TaxID=84072 RepID=UPI00307BF191
MLFTALLMKQQSIRGIAFSCLWVALISLQFSSTECKLVLLERPKDTTVTASSKVYLVCRFGGVDPSKAFSDYSFRWTKGNETIYDVHRNEDEPTVSTVKLLKYDTKSSSSITCSVEGPNNENDHHTCQLRVLSESSSQVGFPEVEMIGSSQKTLQVNTVRQPIRADVTPRDSLTEYRWFKDDIPLEFYPDYDNYVIYTNAYSYLGPGSMEIQKVTNGASGTYTLQVTNKQGTALSSDVVIYARARNYPPKFIGPALPTEIVLKKGQSKVLNCSANAAPIPKIKWYRTLGGVESIVPSTELYEQNYSDLDKDYGSSLKTSYILMNAMMNQTLRCKVTSGTHPPIETIVNVIVLEPPGTPISLRVDADIHTADLKWTPQRAPASLNCTVFYKNTSVENSVWLTQDADSVTGTTLRGLAPYSEYQAKIACSNDVGRGPNSSLGIMKTGEFTPSPPVNLRAQYKQLNNDVKIVEISWQKPERPNGIIQYYNFYYTDYNKKNDNINQWQKRQTKRMYHPEKYPPGKTMVARAQAVNAYGQSELSDIYTFPTTVGVPGVMERFSAEVISSNAVNLSWSSVALIDIKDIKSYRVYYNDSASKGTTRTREISPMEVSLMYDMRYYATIRGLQPDTKYSFTATALNLDDVAGPMSESIACSTFKAVPRSKPVELGAKIVTLNSISLSWSYTSQKDKITNYTVLYRITTIGNAPIVPTDSNMVYFQKISVLETSALVKNLDESTCYDFFVCANNAIGRGPFSANQRMCTIDIQTISAPKLETVEVLNSTSVRLHWTVPDEYNRIADNLKIGFQITYSSPGQMVNNLFDCMGHDLTSCVLTGLQPETTYSFQISILLVSNESPKSNTYNIRTMSPEPNTPFDLQVEIQMGGVVITWDYTEVPKHPVTSFIIKYRILETKEEFEYVHDIRNLENVRDKRRVEFPNLRKGLQYTFRVQARNLNGFSLESEVQIIAVPATLPTGAPRNVNAFALTGRKVFITWQPPDVDQQNGVIQNYLVMASQVGNTYKQNQETKSGLTRTVLINLMAGQTYRVKVAAKNAAGLGPSSDEVEVKTLLSNSSAPQNVQVLPSSKLGSVKVTWDEPYAASIPKEYGYKVFYSENPSLALHKWQTKIVPQKFVMETNLDGLRENTMYGIRVAPQLDSAGTVGALSREVLHRVGPRLHDNFELKPIKVGSDLVVFQWSKPSGVQVTRYKLSHYNMGDPNADKGSQDNIVATATLCVVSELKPFTQYSFNMTVFTLDSIGREVTNLSLQFTLFTKATVPDSISTPLIPTRDGVTSEGIISLRLSQPSLSRGPVDAYQVVLVELLDNNIKVEDLPGPDQIFIENNSKNTVSLIRRQRSSGLFSFTYAIENNIFRRSADTSYYQSQTSPSNYRAAIVAQLVDFYPDFALGDNRYYGNYFNGRLQFSKRYTVFVRALVYSDVIQYRSSDYMDPAFTVQDVMGASMSGGGIGEKDPFVNLLWIVCVVATVIVVIVIFLIAIYLIKRKNHSHANLPEGSFNGSTSKYNEILVMNGNKHHSHVSYANSQHSPTPHSPGSFQYLGNGNGSGMLLGGGSYPPTYTSNYKTVQTDDPVERRRLNFPTNGLEDHQPLICAEVGETVDRLKAKDNYLFTVEFESIEPVQQFTWEHSNMDVNKSKNRYANVIAYDHSRVHLRSIEGVPGSDYINANFMDGYRRERAYISTQGPLEETLGDFWRMVWEQNSYTIVMMTKLEEKSRTKCDRYWPEKVNEYETYGLIEVFQSQVEVYASYTIRTLKIRHIQESGGSREVRQFQFTDWPDHGVPEYATPVIAFVKKIKLSNPTDHAGPLVVHCSAGVGRTGCFIVIDAQMEKMQNEDQVDIYGHVTCLRAQRQYMVQTEDQYIFIYDAILEAIQTGLTEFQKYEMEERVAQLRSSGSVLGDNRTGLEAEFERLSHVTHSPAKFSAAMLPENMAKNRLANIKPFDSTRVKLEPLRGQAGSDYINASYIDSYYQKGAYIATQGPLETTVFDFWRMVWEQNVGVIVMLTKLKELGREKCFQYWPKPNNAERHNYLLVEPVQEYAMAQFVIREFRLCDAREGLTRRIRQFHFDWPEQGVPKQNQAFVEFIRYVEEAKSSLGLPISPVVVHCSSGSARSGVYIALKMVLDRMENEAIVDVFQTVKLLRTQRPAMVQTEDQYEFIYQTALDYFRISDGYDYYNSSRC